MPSIHRVYDYGSIAIEKLCDINISEKNTYIYRGFNDQMKNLASLFPSAKRCNDTNTHNALFSQNAGFFCLKQEESTDIVNIASWFLNIHNYFTTWPI